MITTQNPSPFSLPPNYEPEGWNSNCPPYSNADPSPSTAHTTGTQQESKTQLCVCVYSQGFLVCIPLS